MFDILKSFFVKPGQSKKGMNEDLQKRVNELAILNKMSIALSAGQDLYHALRTFVKELKHVMIVDAFHIGLYDAQTDLFSYSLFLNLDEDLHLPPRNLREKPGLTWEVITSKQILYLPDILEPNTQHTYNIVTVIDVGIRSYIGIPLMLQDRVIGVMSVQSLQPDAYTSDQIRLLETLAANVVITIKKGVLIERLQQELDERIRAEQELGENEQRYRALFEQSNDDIFMIDPKTSLYLDFNRSAHEHLGYSRDELGQLGVINIAKHITSMEYWQERVQLIREKEGLIFEAIYIRKNGTEFPVEVSARILGYGEKTIMLAVVRDITERKNAEESLRQAEVKYRTLIEHIPPIVFIAARDQHIGVTYISPRITSLGFTQEEWIADPELWLRQIHPDDRARVLEEIEKIKRSGELFSSEYRLIARDGVTRWFLDESMDVIDSDGNFLFRQGFMLDITERKRADEEIQQLNAELEHRVEERTAQLNEANQNLHQEKARLEQFNRQREIMSAMTDLLQASITTEEASNIVSTHFKLLFPNKDGALHLTTSPNALEPVAVWGENKSLDVIYTVNECWALRRGKPYRFGVGSPNPPCAHAGKEIPHQALCIPFSAQGESLGNLHISTQNDQDNEFINDEEQKFIETIADSIALAIANLRLREKLHFESIRDGLTGLFNRRYLDETLPREIHRAERSKNPISVLMFDIDRFKKFNDTFGHDAGDVVLKSMAGLILSGVRESDIACRYGGEEFTIILPDTPIEVAARRAEDLRKEASALVLHHNGQNLGNVTISIGVATYPQHGITRDTLIKSADEAAYQAKESGRNRVVVCK